MYCTNHKNCKIIWCEVEYTEAVTQIKKWEDHEETTHSDMAMKIKELENELSTHHGYYNCVSKSSARKEMDEVLEVERRLFYDHIKELEAKLAKSVCGTCIGASQSETKWLNGKSVIWNGQQLIECPTCIGKGKL